MDSAQKNNLKVSGLKNEVQPAATNSTGAHSATQVAKNLTLKLSRRKRRSSLAGW